MKRCCGWRGRSSVSPPRPARARARRRAPPTGAGARSRPRGRRRRSPSASRRASQGAVGAGTAVWRRRDRRRGLRVRHARRAQRISSSTPSSASASSKRPSDSSSARRARRRSGWARSIASDSLQAAIASSAESSRRVRRSGATVRRDRDCADRGRRPQQRRRFLVTTDGERASERALAQRSVVRVRVRRRASNARKRAPAGPAVPRVRRSRRGRPASRAGRCRSVSRIPTSAAASPLRRRIAINASRTGSEAGIQASACR